MLAPSWNHFMNLESLIAWLRTKDPNKPYDWLSTSNCLICQYFKDKGFPNATSGGTYTHPFGSGDMTTVEWPDGFTAIASARWSQNGCRLTFGAALNRAEVLLSQNGG